MDGIVFPVIFSVAVSFGPIDIFWYSFAYVISFVLGWWYARILVARRNTGLTAKNIDEFVIWSVVAVIVGGRLGYVLFYHPLDYLWRPWEIFYFWLPGRSFHGGLLGVVIAGFWYCWRNRVPKLPLGDILSCTVPIGFFFARIASFIIGDLVGRVTDVPWGVVFPNRGPLPRHPSQLYEAVLEGALLFFILFVLERRTPIRKTRPGLMMGIFMMGYGLTRIFAEFFKEPDPHVGFLVGGITMGQILTFPMLLVGVLLSWYVLNQKKSQS